MTAANLTAPAKSNWLPLLLLVVLVVPLRGWLMWNTEVLARDSVTYINYALEIEQKPWGEVLLKNHQHPGYPLAIWAVSLPVRHYLGPADSFTMQLSAELASNIAAVLLIFPMYYLGRFFFERRVAFWGTLLFQYLPVSGQHLSDGVSEALFLLLTSTAFLCSLWALRRQSVVLFVACGIFCGLAYLTRPEGALVFVSTALVLVVGPLLRGWKQSWKGNFRCGLAMTLAGLAVGSAYFGFTHKFTNKPSYDIIRGERDPQKAIIAVPSNGPGNGIARTAIVAWPSAPPHPDPRGERGRDKRTNLRNPRLVSFGLAEKVEPQETASSAQPLFAQIFGNVVEKGDPLMQRLGKGFFMFGAEYLQIFHYGGLLALIFGTIWRVRSLFAVPEFLVPTMFVLMHCSLILALAAKAGYLSNRHLLAVAAWGVYFTAAGFCDFPGWLRQWWLGKAAALVRGPNLSRISVLMLLAFVGLCLPRTAQKLHANQAGNHLAGQWLSEHVKKGDFIHDNHGWSLYYAGEIFHQAPEPPAKRHPKSFVVITRTRDPKTIEKQKWQDKHLREHGGQAVYHWPENVSASQARIVIYEVDRMEHVWWNSAP